MSAFVVNLSHIDALLQFASRFRANRGNLYYWHNGESTYFSRENLDKIGQVLLDENYRSVNYRYSESDKAEVYKYVRPSRTYTPVEILSACNCYEYQACETDDWRDSEAYTILQTIKGDAIRSLPGYDDAPYEIVDYSREENRIARDNKLIGDLIMKQHYRNEPVYIPKIDVPVEEKLNSDLKSLSSAILANTSERQCIACEGKGTIGDEECPDCGGKGNYNAKRMWCVANKNYVAFTRTEVGAQILRDNNPILRYARINEIIQMEPSKIEYKKIYNKQTCPGYYK